MVELLFTDPQLRQSLREDHLKCLPDFFRLGKKLQRGKGALQDVVKVYQAVQKLSGLCQALEQYCGDHKALLSELFSTPLSVSLLQLPVELLTLATFEVFSAYSSFDVRQLMRLYIDGHSSLPEGFYFLFSRRS